MSAINGDSSLPSYTIPLTRDVRDAYQNLYDNIRTAIDSTMELVAIEALNKWWIQIDQILTLDAEYTLAQDTNIYAALQKQIKYVNDGIEELRDQIGRIASRLATAADIIASIDKVLSLFPSEPQIVVDDKVGANPIAKPRAQIRNVGPSTHVARDKWTTDDFLGYYPYAYAIYRFLTDSDTAPPLAISIQAPWGGGKTSLMRMIQAQLDPDNPVFQAENTKPSSDGELSATVEHIHDFIESDNRENSKESIDVGTAKNRVTVWFNAWKYESTDQILGGASRLYCETDDGAPLPSATRTFLFSFAS